MWWQRHAPEFLDLKQRIYAPRITSRTPTCLGRSPNRKDAERPMRRAVECRVIPDLIRALHAANSNREIRIAALGALGRVDAFDTTVMMRKIVLGKAGSENLRVAAVMSLRLMRGQGGDPTRDEIEISLREMASNKRLPESVRAAAEYACSTSPARALPSRIADADRARWVLRAARCQDERQSPRFLHWLENPKTPLLTRRASVVAAGRMVPLLAPVLARQVVDSLRAIVRGRSQDPELRVLACFALADAGTTESRFDLFEFARFGDLAVRIASLLGLSQRLEEFDGEQRLHLRADARALGSATLPEEYRSIVDVCRALHSDKSAIPELVRRVPRDPSASLALGLLLEARPTVLTALRAAVRKTSNPYVRKNAAIALAMLRKPAHLDLLLPRLRTAQNYSELASIVEILGHVGAQLVVDPLLDILCDPRRPAALRASAAQALGRAGDLRSVSAFTEGAHLFVPGLSEPTVEAWLAQR